MGEHLSGNSAPEWSRRLFQMGQTVRLIRLIERLAELDDEDTIYAREPWTKDSDAMVAPDDPKAHYGIPPEAADAGMQYFLEVHIAREICGRLDRLFGCEACLN